MHTPTPVVTAPLFTIARIWKQPKSPLRDEWTKKIQYIYIMEYYSSIRRNNTVSLVETWMDVESGIQSELCQKEKSKY